MSDAPSPPEPASPLRRTAARAALAGIGLVWLVPVLALVAVLAIGWNAWGNRGRLIEVEFADAAGVVPGETVLRFREITVGRVQSVRFTPDLSRVVVGIGVDRDVAPFIDSRAAFWIVRPQLTTQGVTRLDTVLTGAFIEGYWDAEISDPQTRFTGLERPPMTREDARGTWIALRAEDAGGLTDGAPILYRGVPVGRMENLRVSESGGHVVADAFVEAPHDARLTSATVFWNTSGFSVSLGAQGLAFNVNSLASLMRGGIAFDTLVSGGGPVARGHVFQIQPDESAARARLFADGDGEPLLLDLPVEGALHGLEKGAEVRFQGLRVGQVVDLAVEMADGGEQGPHPRQLVTIAVSPERLGLPRGASAGDALAFLETAVEAGLRGRIAGAGLFGTSLMVELVEIADAPPARIDGGAGPNPRIPAVEGDSGDLDAGAQGMLGRIGNLPIKKMLKSATGMMDGVIGPPDADTNP